MLSYIVSSLDIVAIPCLSATTSSYKSSKLELISGTVISTRLNVFKLYFDKSIDLNLIKKNLVEKHKKASDDLKISSEKLANSSFIYKAPKNIVDQEKTNYSNLKNDIQKITLTIESL